MPRAVDWRNTSLSGSPCAGADETGAGLAAGAVCLLPHLAMLSGLLAVACGAVLALRRFSGAFETGPGPVAALAACGTGLLLVTIGDLATRAAGPGTSSLPAVLTRLGLLLALSAVSLPWPSGSPPVAIATLLAMLVSVVAAFGGPAIRRFAARRRFATGVLRSPARAAEPPHRHSAAAINHPDSERQAPAAAGGGSDPLHDRHPQADPATTPGGSLLQRFERLTLPGGAETVRGRLCVVVPAGTRTGYAHVGFCPPLAAAPTVEATTDYDGVEAVVSVAEVLPWGARVECRLDEPAEERIDIPVDILATTSE